MEAALHLFRARGYAATTVDDICERAALTKGSFFHHFESKEGLAVAAARHFSEKAGGLFAENCVRCHGTNGRAHTFHGIILGAQNLTDAKWQLDTTDDEIIHAIKTGPHAMPAFDKKLSESEIEALAVYVRTFKAAN